MFIAFLAFFIDVEKVYFIQGDKKMIAHTLRGKW